MSKGRHCILGGVKRAPLRRSILAAAAALLAVATAFPGSELVLVDGKVLRGESVRRDGDDYVLTTEIGEVTLPVELVSQVRLIETSRPETRGDEEAPKAPTGFVEDRPQQIAGKAVRPPSTEEQLRNAGRTSTFQKDIIDSRWEPSTDWNMDPETQNNWAPSTWAKDIVDTRWEPTSAFDANKDVLADSRSTWKTSIIDSSWEPTDGFKKD